MAKRVIDNIDIQAELEGIARKKHNQLRLIGVAGKRLQAMRKMVAAGERVQDNRVNGRHVTR